MESPGDDAPPSYTSKEGLDGVEEGLSKNGDPAEIQWLSDVSSSKSQQFDPKDSLEEENMQENNGVVKAPDGGYGWVIVFAVFMIHFILDGVNFSFGQLYPFIIDEMKTTEALASTVVSVLMGVTFFCGPLSSVLSTKFGHRTVALCGAIIAFCGAVSGFFSTLVWHLILTYGVVMGVGFGGVYLPAVVSAVTWFDKRRARAVGIAVCGSGIGIMSFSLLIPILIDHYGLHGWFLIQSAIVCNTIVFAALLRPLPHLEKQKKSIKDSRRPSLEMDELPTAGEKVLKVKEVTEEADRNCCATVVHTVRNMAIFRMWQYWVMLLVVFLCGLSGYIPFIYLNHRAEKEAGIERDRTQILVFVTGGFNLFGRLFAGVTDHPWINRLIVYSSAYIISGIATVFSTVFCSDLITFAVYGAFYGFTGGVIIALQSVVLADIVGIEHVSTALGISLFVLGISALCGPPIAGAIVGAQGGSYTLTFIIFGIMMAIGGAIFLIVPITKMIQRRRRKSPQESDASTRKA